MKKELIELHQEYTKLKDELFKGSSFAVLDDKDENTIRYNQLFQFFHPEFRSKAFISPLPECRSTIDIDTFVRNLIILERRVIALNAVKTVRVGDYVRQLNGKIDRITYVWEDHVQTGGCSGSFYLGEGYVSYSGGLDPGIPKAKLDFNGEMKKGLVWFFNRDWHTADNGAEFVINFRVYNELE